VRQIKVLAISGLACVLAAGLLIMALPTSKPPDLQELLGNANNRTQQRLYSGARNAKTGALLTLLDESVEIDLPHTRFITYKDRSTEDQLLVPNSQHMLSSRLYFPVQLGEDGRRLHIARTFVPNLNHSAGR
jgi:hypothetical protein